MENNLIGNSPIDKINRDMAESVAQKNSQIWKIPYIDLVKYPINIDFLNILDKKSAEVSKCVVFNKKGKSLELAIVDPKNPELTKVREKLKSKNFELSFYLCSEESLKYALKYYDSNLLHKKKLEITKTFDENKNNFAENLPFFQKLETKIKTQSISEILSEVYLLSLASKASDIHFQPLEKYLILRIRVDGVLHDVMKIPLDISQKMITQIKYDAGMKSNIIDTPQDGRIEFIANERKIELRVSTLPMKLFESVVMRILDNRKGIKSFSELGFYPNVEKKIINSLYKKNGIVLVTGPTGSGKTTTLYSMLKELNSREKKLVSLEDPIEYHLEGVSQSQVNEKSDFNFETGFKSLLRQNPDVILVGEIRTIATAKLAFEAALTGHTVLSSLHTNSSVGTISRLRNMGMDNFNIAPTISAVFSQKLVRKIFNKDKIIKKSLEEIMENNQLVKKSVDIIREKFPNQKIPTKIIIDVENHEINLSGQTVVCESFVVDDKIREMILEDISYLEIEKHLYKNTDFIDLFTYGLIKVFDEKITLNELIRSVGN